MVSKSEVLFYGLYAVSLIMILATINNFLEINNQPEKVLVSNCENFNGRDFLLTGGSSKPSTPQEVNFEMRRLQWLCAGGTRQ
jgi:hypothetical protein